MNTETVGGSNKIQDSASLQEWINASHREEKKFIQTLSVKKYRIKTIYSLAKYIINLFFFSFVLAAPAIMVWLYLASYDFSIYACLVAIKDIVAEMESIGSQDCTPIRDVWVTMGWTAPLASSLHWSIPSARLLRNAIDGFRAPRSTHQWRSSRLRFSVATQASLLRRLRCSRLNSRAVRSTFRLSTIASNPLEVPDRKSS